MIKFLYIIGDTWMYDFGGNVWSQISSGTPAPSPRYGFVGGLINNFWIISHGNSFLG